MSSLALLEQMSNYSTEMVDAARANDWDRLTRLERQVASLRDRLGVEEALAFPSRPKRMSEDERAKKVALIRRGASLTMTRKSVSIPNPGWTTFASSCPVACTNAIFATPTATSKTPDATTNRRVAAS